MSLYKDFVPALPAATLAGPEQIALVQSGTTKKTTAAAIAAALSGAVALVSAQVDYTVDISALGLATAPRGCVASVALPTGASNFGAFMDTSLTTATSLHLHCDAVPTGVGYLSFNLIP